MKKQPLLICFILLFSAAALVWAYSDNKKEEAAAPPAHTCAKSCKAESKQAISTGFFIIDSFSGIL